MKSWMKVGAACAIVAATLSTLTGCLGGAPRRPVDRPGEPTRDISSSSIGAKPALDDKRLQELGLEVYWDSNIRGEAIAKLELEGNCLYAITDSNRIYQIDLYSGKVNWVYDVGQPVMFMDHDNPIAEHAYPKSEDNLPRYDEIYFLAKDTLYALDKKGGADVWRLQLPFGASSPPEPTATHVLVGSWDDWVYAIKKSSQPISWDWKWRTNGDIVARGAYESPYAMIASTDGALYTFDVSKGELTGDPFKTERPITGDPLIHRKLVYLGGEDMNLYVINIDGRLEGRYPIGAPIKKRPVAVGNDIYVVTDRVPGDRPEDPRHGVVAFWKKGRDVNIRKTVHEQKWTRLKADKFLARGRDSVYLLEPDDRVGAATSRKIVKVDAKDGYFRDELATDASFFVSNAFDPNQKPAVPETVLGGIVFVGYRNGWIVALKEKSQF